MRRTQALGDLLRWTGLGLLLVALGGLAISQGGVESTLLGVSLCVIGCIEVIRGYRRRDET